MSLQLRLTLTLAALLGTLALAALFGLDALTRDMRAALGDTARSVGAQVFTIVRERQVRLAREAADGAGRGSVEVLESQSTIEPGAPGERALEVLVDGRRLSRAEIAALPDTHPAHRLLGAPAAGPWDGLRLELEPSPRSPQVLWLRGDHDAVPIPIPASAAERAIEEFRDRLLWGLGALLLTGLLIAAWLARRIAAPLRELSAASERLGRGELEQHLAPSGPPEVRRSLEAFNRMATDLRRLQAETEALRADRELAELGEIGRGLAHSLRNPLHALGLSLDALADGSRPERAAQLADSGRQQLARIDQALRGFLALSASAGTGSEPVDLDEVVDDVLLEASQRAAGSVQLRREGRGLQLQGVTAELRIVLHALVINALEASPEGGEVEVRAEPFEDGVRIEIADRGPGLPDSVRRRLFQPHVSSKPAGAGMGLYLAERLVRQRYRGSLCLLPREGGGCLARLQLRAREARQGAP